MTTQTEEILKRNSEEFIQSRERVAVSVARSQLLNEIKEKLEHTFDGCACGYHGYLVLPDCDENDHEIEECARCILTSMEKELK